MTPPASGLARLLAIAGITAMVMLPVTGVVPVLKGILPDRYGTGEFATSIFMSINMLGALLAAPVAGRLADTRGWTKRILVGACAADAALWAAMAALPPFPWLVALRTLEGAAHIAALSMLLAIAGRESAEAGRRSRMAAVGAAIVLGVAVGAPIGGWLGRGDPAAPLRAGAWLMGGVTVVCAALPVPRTSGAVRGPGAAHGHDDGGGSLLRVPTPLRVPYLFSFADRFSVGVFVVAFPLLCAGPLGLPPDRIGMLIGVFMLPFALLNWPAGKLAERVGPWKLVIGGSAVYAVAFAAVPWTPPGGMLPVMAACGVISAVMFGPTLVLVIQRSTQETRARAVAGFNAAGSLGFLIGPLAAGSALQYLDGAGWAETDAHRAVFAAGGSVQFVAIMAAARARRTEPDPPAAPAGGPTEGTTAGRP